MIYELALTRSFQKAYNRFAVKNPSLRIKVQKTLNHLASDPFNQTLRSHRVATRHFGVCWSSSVTGDIRIVWDFSKEEQLTILVIGIGTHSGKRKVYK